MSDTIEHRVAAKTAAHAGASPALARALFDSIFESSAIGIYVFRIRDGTSVLVNDAFLRFIGRSRDDVEGRAIGDLGLFTDSTVRDGWMTRLQARGHVAAEHARIRLRSGEVREIVAALTLVDVDGERLVVACACDETPLSVAQQRLADSETLFRRAFETTNVGKSITLPTGEVFVNAAFATMLGYQRDELTDRRWQDLTPPEDVASVQAVLDGLLRGEHDSVRFAKRYLHRDRSIVWADVNTVLWRDSDRQPRCFITSIVDVTQRREAEARLKLSEELFSKAFHASPAGLTITKIADGTFLEVNEAFLRMFGYERDEVIRHSSVELHMLEPDARARLIEAQLRSGGLANADLRAHAKSGAVVDVVFSSRPIRVGDDWCHVTSMIDVTERKAAEHDLRASEERYRRLTENVPDLVWRSDAEGRILFTNGVAREMLGFPPEVLVGRLPREYLTEASSRAVAEWLADMSTSPARPEHLWMEVDYLNSQGGTVRGEIHALPVFGHDGTLLSIEGVTRDVGVRKRDAAERTKLHGELIQAQKLESIGRLAGGAAHDFNNILSVIMSYASMVADDLREADPMRADLLEILAAARRGAALTRQLLAFSRKQVVEPTIVNVNDLVRSLERMLGRLLGEDIAIDVRLASDLGQVYVDANQLEQVIVNLAVNARDAMPTGGRLAIETASEGAPDATSAHSAAVPAGRTVVLLVRDTGVGMDPSTLERIFEPFFTTKDPGKGTGLGLSTAFGIVKQAGGSISVESVPGRGTTFRVALPVVEACPVVGRSRPAPATLRGHERVLVVEDDEPLLRMLSRVLSAAGYDVATAADGDDALRLAKETPRPIELLVADVVMPNLSGQALCQKVLDRWPNVRTLLMSGYSDETIAHHGVQPSGVSFIAKPFTPADLLLSVRAVLDSSVT